ncbi:bacteriohemerythrin [Maridesulfovibrio sp. FT414]|uniref:bacteriohemerythrin n=1 Tax=Maridesulfovibrio sp. FT414 TaxID=2979469 RepID=UPI003D804CB3
MARIEWHDGLKIGVEEIDNQHKELIRIVNEVLDKSKSGKEDAALDALFGQLREYAVYHFNSEEKYMEQIEYPYLAEQKRAHKELKGKVKQLQSARFHKEHVSWEEAKDLLARWLIEHLLHEDFKIGQFVKSGGGKGWKG